MRTRKVANGELVKFCEKCDREYLMAMLEKKKVREEPKGRKAIEKIVQEYEMLERVMKIEREKIEKSGNKE